MPDGATIAVYSAAALALLLVPGPAVVYVVAQSIHGGRRAGLVSVLGLHMGTMVHVGAAAVGLSSLLVSSATAFEVVKYARAAFVNGIVVNVLNPKTALFFFAFLPQFVDVSAGSVALQMVFLGLVFVAFGLVTDSLYALAAGTAGGWLRARPRAATAERYVSGSVFLGLGLATALSGSRKA